MDKLNDGVSDSVETSHINAIKDYRDQMFLKRYSQNTIKIYLTQFGKFLKFYERKFSTDLTDEDVKHYLLTIFNEREVSLSLHKQIICSIKFFYEKILRRETKSYYLEIPKTKQQKLPVILSKSEVTAIINCTNNLKHKAILSTIYSGGFRISEAIDLHISDIDSDRMVINIRGGKGAKDRVTILSDELLTLLRDYFRKYRPKTWLFENQQSSQISARFVQSFFVGALKKSRVNKKASVHTLRHSFATHLLEDGVEVSTIQKLLGHKSIKTTEIYTHITSKALKGIKSPFDDLSIGKIK